VSTGIDPAHSSHSQSFPVVSSSGSGAIFLTLRSLKVSFFAQIMGYFYFLVLRRFPIFTSMITALSDSQHFLSSSQTAVYNLTYFQSL
jgi:hypothetical protein